MVQLPSRMRTALPAVAFLVLALAAGRAGAAQRVLLVGEPGDTQVTRAVANLRAYYQARGFTVDERSFVPGDLSGYCCAWDVRPHIDIAASESASYLDLLQRGHGLGLIGEHPDGFYSRDLSITSFIRDYPDGGAPAVDPGVVLAGTTVEDANPGHQVNNNPNRVRRVAYNGYGSGAFMSLGTGTWLTAAASSPGITAVAWEEGDLRRATTGRLVAVLDLNWLVETLDTNDTRGFMENVSEFLCPTAAPDLTLTITDPLAFTLECPDPLSVRGVVTGSGSDCAQPTTIAAAPRIVAIEVSLNGGPWFPVTSTSPALPAPPTVSFLAANLGLRLGGNTVVVRARDENGQIVTDQVSGNQLDTIPPAFDPATCQDVTVDLGPGCHLDYSGTPAANDRCDPLVDVTALPPLPIPFNGPGTVQVTYTARDDAGLTDVCQRDVTAVDLSPPTLSCAPPATIECSATGGTPDSDPAVVAFLAGTTASDNCSANPTLSDDHPPFFPSACPPGRETIVTWTASDDSGRQSNCAAGLRVQDSTPPDLTAVPGPLTLECNTRGGVADTDPRVQAWLAGFAARDLCSASTSRSDDHPALFPYGCPPGRGTTVAFEARDDCANPATANATLTVADSQPPTVTPPGPLNLECTDPGGVPAADPRVQAWLGTATAADICADATVSDDAPALLPAGCAPGRTTVVTFTGRDLCGNAWPATAPATVADTTPPALAVPAPILLECGAPGGLPASDPRIQAWLGAATSSDLCGASSVGHDAPGFFPSGCGAGQATTVRFTATDGCALASALDSTVTVVDRTNPILTAPPPLDLECSSPGGVPLSDPRVQSWLAQATASDTCGPAPVSHDAPALLPSGCGAGTVTVVTFTARDACGNQSRSTSSIRVHDTTRPDLTPPPPLALECSSPGGVPASDPRIQAWLAAATASDTCGLAPITHDAPALLPSGCGTGTVTVVQFTATDACGLTTTRTSTVTVRDTTAPDLSLPAPLELECTTPGGVPASDPRIQAWLAQATAVDTCEGPEPVGHDAPARFAAGCGPGAVTLVTFTSRDRCGNLASGSAAVTVRDTTAPALDVPAPATLECNSPGGVPAGDPQVQSWLGQARATDICHGVRLDNDAPALFPSGCPPGATTTVRFGAEDDCGNRSEKPSTLTVLDSTPPRVTGCALPVVPPPLPPRPARAGVSACSGATSAQVRVDCGGTADLCDPAPATEARFLLTLTDVVAGTCVRREEPVTVACGELVWLERVAPPCPARPPRSPRPALSVRSDGIKVLFGEAIRLEVVGRDGCGNASPACTVDATGPDGPVPCPPRPPRCPVSRCGG